MKKYRISFSILIVVLTTLVLNAQNIYTVAGGDGNGDSVKSFGIYPSSVATDASGNIYVADACSAVVYKITSSGILEAVAGNGVSGYYGDGVPATSTSLIYPQSIAIDASGNIFIADYDRIRKVNTSGIITTIAGNDSLGYGGDGGPATAAILDLVFSTPYVSDNNSGLAVDKSGNIYIADAGNNRIRKINSSGIISTIAGNGTAGYSGDGGQATAAELWGAEGLAVDASGNVFIAEGLITQTQTPHYVGNNRVRKINSAGIISTVAGKGSPGGFGGDGGPATAASLWNPVRVALDASGNLYIADANNNRIRKINSAGVISTVTGDNKAGYNGDGGTATASSIYNPAGVALDASGNIFIADFYNYRVRKVNTSSVISTIAGNGTSMDSAYAGPTTGVELNGTCGGALDASGNFYFADQGNVVIRKIDKSGYMTIVAGNGVPGYSGDGGPATAAELMYPAGVKIDPAGNMYIADYTNSRIRKVSSTGTISNFAGDSVRGYSGDGGPATAAELYFPGDVALDVSGNLYIADCFNNRVRKVNTSGIISTIAGDSTGGYSGDGGPATAAELFHPTNLTFDASGNLLIVDAYNNCVRKVNTVGIISTFAGNDTAGFSGDGGPATAAELDFSVVFEGPYGVGGGLAVDDSGNVFISDYVNNRIRKVNTSGIINTVAGSIYPGYTGDGGAATAAELYYPNGVTVDGSGNIFIADFLNNRIREVTKGSALAINELPANSNTVIVYPNPSSGLFTFQMQGVNEKAQIEIYNVLGQKIDNSQWLLANNSMQVDLSNRPAGIYLYRITTEKGELVGSGKLIIER